MQNILFIGTAIASLVLLGLSIYTVSKTSRFSLPIPSSLQVLTVISPILSPLLPFLTGYFEKHAVKGALIYSWLDHWTPKLINTVLAVLSGDRLSQAGEQHCLLRDHWQHLFQAKDGNAIKAIQEHFQCCGFRSLNDMPWPFPGGNKTNPDTCRKKFEYTQPCEESWASEEKSVLTTLLVVAILGAAINFICESLFSGESWYNQQRRAGNSATNEPVQASSSRLLEHGGGQEPFFDIEGSAGNRRDGGAENINP